MVGLSSSGSKFAVTLSREKENTTAINHFFSYYLSTNSYHTVGWSFFFIFTSLNIQSRLQVASILYETVVSSFSLHHILFSLCSLRANPTEEKGQTYFIMKLFSSIS
jgi:hypothetical protein